MTDGTILVLVFEDVSGNQLVHSYPYAKPSVNSAQVKTLMDAIIANNDIFTHCPTKKVRAYKVSSYADEIDLS